MVTAVDSMCRHFVPGFWLLTGCLGLAMLLSGCQRGPAPGSQAENGVLETGENQNSAAKPDRSSVHPPAETGSATVAEDQRDQPDLDEQIRMAAGPLADQVNSSLARLNSNLAKKEHTLVIMAMKSETRRWYFLNNFTGLVNDEQMLQATAIIDSHAGEYQDLLDRRARILENARDGQGTEQLLEYNKVAAIKLSIQVRKQIIREVLDREQKAQYAARFESPQPVEPKPDGN